MRTTCTRQENENENNTSIQAMTLRFSSSVIRSRHLVYRLIHAVPNIHETADSIPLFCLHLLVNEPKCMDMTGEVTQDSQANVDEQVTATSSDQSRRGRREQDGYNYEENV